MKVWKRIAVVCTCLLMLFGVYYGSYKIYLYTVGRQDAQQFAKKLSKKSVEANQSGEHKITNKTKLTVEYYNRAEESSMQESMSMPVEYVGMTRTELEKYLEEYGKEPSLEDVSAGFEKYQILSFSSSDVVLRKIFAPSGTEYKYYMIQENGCITVYYIDKRTVFEYTNIVVETLPEDVREQVECGRYVMDDDALYDFLETYSS